MVSGRAGTALKRAGRWPFRAVGLDVVRKGTGAGIETRPAVLGRPAPARAGPRVRAQGDLRRRCVPRLLVPGRRRDLPRCAGRDDRAEPARARGHRDVGRGRPTRHPIVVDVAIGDAPGSAQLHIWRDADADRGASLLENVSGEAKMSDRRGGADARQRLRRPRPRPRPPEARPAGRRARRPCAARPRRSSGPR